MTTQPSADHHPIRILGIPVFVVITIFIVTIFISAFLLFQVQPLISRYILPWFGGTPAVWSASMLFFQAILLAGYAFAHWLASRTRLQMGLYLFLLLTAVVAILLFTIGSGAPLLPGIRWRPVYRPQPFFDIILILLLSVGLPYFLLSTTSPLLQSWFKALYPERSPYRLYVLSNLGSFIGLLSYPFLFEPLLRLREQAWLWFALYLVYSGLCAFLAFKMGLSGERDSQTESDLSSSREGENHPASPPSAFHKILWISLAACTSILLLSITNQLTQEVAVVPFLWVLPLSIYLFSFMLAFSGKRWYPQLPIICLLAAATLGMGYAMNALTSTGMLYQIIIFSLFLLFAAWACHGELYRIRPDARYLTSFYLYISLGGVIGGLFVNLLAPLIFNGYWELHLGVLLCWLLVIVLQFVNRPSIFDIRLGAEAIPFLLVILGGGAYLFIRHIGDTTNAVVAMERNFYGVIRVQNIAVGDDTAYSLKHGVTAHGFQFHDEEKSTWPTTYYGPESGVGLTLRYFEDVVGERKEGLKVGLVGLGTGTLAAYGEPDDDYRFYEINPDIVDLALGEDGYYSYLADSPAEITIALGDARIVLETELAGTGPQGFDILAIDAFSSDAIPIHLLTVEAVGLYLEHLKEDGVLALHISNRYLNLAPLVRKLASYFEVETVLIRSVQDEARGTYTSTWMLLSANEDFFDFPKIRRNAVTPPAEDPDLRIWTDDYSNLLPLIKINVFTTIQ